MKLLKALTALAIIGLVTSYAYADDKAPAKGDIHRGAAKMMEHLLPPPILDDLKLTADQKTKYDGLETAFKKDADAWDKTHPGFKEEMQKAHAAKDKDAIKKLLEQRKPLMDTRKGYVEQLRASLTDEQKATLDKGLAEIRERMGKGPRGDQGEKKSPKPAPAE
ncbi:MAG: Spy/CpxP family protein refolding chaperone [Verrucomicrobiota bacterium]